MTLLLVKYLVPMLIGYSLFAAISGRLNPLTLTHPRENRATWYLGVWVGLSTALVLSLAVYMASTLPLNAASSVALPSAILLTCLCLPAIALYFYYSNKERREARKQAVGTFDWALSEDDLEHASTFDADMVTDHPLDLTLSEHSEHSANVSPAFLQTVKTNQLSHDCTQEAINDADTTYAEEQTASQSVGTTLEQKLEKEKTTRKATEKHLRVTRKALALLESETRNIPDDSSEKLIELEESLAKAMGDSATIEAKYIAEQSTRMNLEIKNSKMRTRLLAAKTEIRQGAAARAKALSTANQSIAFARQSLQIRRQLERELAEAQTKLDNQQMTISSLIRALEKEKLKTQDEVSLAARQLVSQEKRARTKRTVETVARNVENKLSSRLVKKVAKARPLVADAQHTGIN